MHDLDLQGDATLFQGFAIKVVMQSTKKREQCVARMASS